MNQNGKLSERFKKLLQIFLMKTKNDLLVKAFYVQSLLRVTAEWYLNHILATLFYLIYPRTKTGAKILVHHIETIKFYFHIMTKILTHVEQGIGFHQRSILSSLWQDG